MEKNRVRFAVIGTNFITERLLQAAKSEERFVLSSVYSRTRERAEEFARKWGAERIFTSLDDLADTDQVDAVYIASPNSFHCGQALKMIQGGKHVLCEKAFASNALQAEEMIRAARRRGVVLMEAMRTTVTPNFLQVKKMLPKLGTVRRYSASYCQYSSRYDRYRQGEVLNAFRPEFSNGAMMDIGVYCLAPMVHLFGRPDSLEASSTMLESGVDGQGTALFSYPGMQADVRYSKITDSSLPSEIQGEEGVIRIGRINLFESILWIPRGGSPQDVSLAQAENDMVYELSEFIDTVLSGKVESSLNTHDATLTVMQIMDQIRRQTGLVYPADREF